MQGFLVPEKGTWWACDSGLTPCISVQVFDSSANYCVMVQILPRVLFHDAESFEGLVGGQITHFRREPVSLTLAILLGIGAAAGVGTGAAAMIRGSQQMAQLETAIDQDLKALETSITALQESLTSLSEVVLQNRRGLDLLFMREGGLCAALREECCFYADHPGVVKESLSKLRKRLEECQRERKTQQGWFESWFTQSPWLTTLLSALAGPLIILMLLLTVGPCVLNRIVSFLQAQIGEVKLMVIRQQYASLAETESETPQ
ncbi:hypothetical protein H1C71_020740 [Ictidomys tridecemlineatus]|nr:hypothetical protein H1C71_020740 [Ictidomys tridecemlineatus]